MLAKEHWYFLCGILVVVLPLATVFIAKKLQAWHAGPDRTLNVQVAGSQQRKLHAFFSEGNGHPAPAIVLFHGGRWLYSGPHAMYPQCRFFAAQGITCFAAEYNLGTHNRPAVKAAIDDALHAYHYITDHAQDLNIDADRIAVGGGSAGGHLAAMLALQATDSEPKRQAPAALILYNPVLDLAPGAPDHHLVQDFWREVSPLHQIHAAIPPTLIMVGNEDLEVPLSTVETFCSAVEKAGGLCEAEIYPGQRHGFFNDVNGKNPYFEKTNQRALHFLQTVFGR